MFVTAPGRPGELSLIMIALNAVNISWTEPSSPNGVILEYEVSYRQDRYVDGKCNYSLCVKISHGSLRQEEV